MTSEKLLKKGGRPWTFTPEQTSTLIQEVSSTQFQDLRVGFIGCAKIGKKTWKTITAAGGAVVALGSRDAERAAQYGKECCAIVGQTLVPKVMSYEALCTDPTVNVVYVPVPTGTRKEWVILAARNKKHIVCEKPAATSSEALKEMLEECARNGVQFIDGTMLSHGARIGMVSQSLSQLGPIRGMNFMFSFNGGDEFNASNVRVKKELEPYGCLGDLAWYAIRYTLHIMDEAMPLLAIGRVGSESEDGVPLDFSGQLVFMGGMTMSFFSSFRGSNTQTATVVCDQGTLTVKDFCLPFYKEPVSYYVAKHVVEHASCEERYRQIEEKIVVPGETSTFQETQLWKNMASQVSAGSIDSHWPQLTLKTQVIMDALYQSSQTGGEPVTIKF
eukprot:PhF_6_TR42778/c0_g1_i1/m.64718